MPYSKDPSTYPPEFARLFDRAQREAFELDVGDHGEAQALRHKLHAFRRAVESARLPGFGLLRNIVLKVRGTRVVFTNQNDIMAAVRSAAGVESPTEEALAAYVNSAFEGDTDVRSIPATAGGSKGLPGESQEKGQDQIPVAKWQDIFGIEESSDPADEE